MNINAFISLWLEDEEENYEDSLKIFENFYRTYLEIQSLNLSENDYDSNIKNGLNDKMIKIIKKMKMGKSAQLCSVCTYTFEKNESIRKLPCKHIFHEKCIMPWLKMSVFCPNCRLNLKEFFEKEEKKNNE